MRYRVTFSRSPGVDRYAASLAEARRMIRAEYGRTFRIAAGNVNAPSWHHYRSLCELRNDQDGGHECAIAWPVAEDE